MSRLRNIPGAREKIAASPFVVQEPEQQRGKWRAFFQNDRPICVEIGTGKGKFLMEMAAAHPENNYIGIEMYSAVLLKAVQRAETATAETSSADSLTMETSPAELLMAETSPAEPLMAEPSLAEPLMAGKREKPNFCFIRYDATSIESLFAPGEVDVIYLNFSDPWPKDRHAHRRLTSDRFLTRYKKILAPGGRLEFKTDNEGLFIYSLEMIDACGWDLLESTRDLYGIIAAENIAENIAENTAENIAENIAEEDALQGNIASEYELKFVAAGKRICKLIARPSGIYLS